MTDRAPFARRPVHGPRLGLACLLVGWAAWAPAADLLPACADGEPVGWPATSLVWTPVVCDDEPPDPHHDEPEPAPGGPLNPAAPPRPGQPINDRALYRYLQAEGEKLVRAGRTLTNWDGQLGHKTCRLRLPAPGKRRMTPAELAARAEGSVVVFGTFYHCDKCARRHLATASGFLLSESGAAATCRHLLANPTNRNRGVVALTRDGRVCPVREVLAADPVQDLLILQLEGGNFVPLPLAAEAPPGSPVLVMSHPDQRFFSVTTGIVSRHWKTRRRDGGVTFLSITAEFARGSSGAPVLNPCGAVIGLANNTDSIYHEETRARQFNLQMVVHDCVPATALLELIRQE